MHPWPDTREQQQDTRRPSISSILHAGIGHIDETTTGDSVTNGRQDGLRGTCTSMASKWSYFDASLTLLARLSFLLGGVAPPHPLSKEALLVRFPLGFPSFVSQRCEREKPLQQKQEQQEHSVGRKKENNTKTRKYEDNR